MPVQTVVTFDSDGLTLGSIDSAYIAAGAHVSGNTAIYGNGGNQMVHILGTVVGSTGVYLSYPGTFATNYRVLIESTGYVGSYGSGGFGTTAVQVDGMGGLVENHGRIFSYLGAGVALGSYHGATSTLVNDGLIDAVTGVLALSNSAIAIVNSGTIKAAQRSFHGFHQTTDTITNTGRMIGTIEFGDGNDVYNGASGHLTGKLLGGAGTDTARGGVENDWFEGGSEADTLYGNLGNDTLKGDAGADKLYGGLGKDVLTGGSEADAFVFNTAPNSATNFDAVTDFTRGIDKFWLENAVFTKLGGPGPLNPAFFRAGTVALDANDFLVYNRATGALYYDVNANAAGGAVMIASLAANKPVLAASDFVVI